MKLLSTLFTALALVASVFAAPKASAADISLKGSSIDIEDFGDDAWIKVSDSEATLYIDFNKASIKTVEGEFVLTGDYTLADCLADYTYYDIDSKTLTDLSFHIDGSVDSDKKLSVTRISGSGTLKSGESIDFVYDENDFDDSDANIKMYEGASAAVMAEDPSYSDGIWTIKLAKGDNAASYVLLYIKAAADGFGTGKTYTFADFMPDAQHQSRYYNYTFTKMKNITLSGNPTEGACEISGSAEYKDKSGNAKVVKFSYVKSDEPYIPQNYELKISNLSNPFYSAGAWDIQLSTLEGDKVSISLKKAKEVFAGEYTLSDCDASYTYCTIEGIKRTFKELSFTIKGTPTSGRVIKGTGTLENDDTVTFSYFDTTESVVFQYEYATYCNADNNVELPEGVEACVAFVDAEGLHVVPAYSQNEIIPAGTPVLLHGESIATLTYTEAAGKDLDGFVENHLQGSGSALTVSDVTSKFSEDDYYFYALTLGEADNAESLGFYWHVAEGKAFDVPAGKAYLPVLKSLVDSLDGARSGFSFSDATGIRTVAAEAQNAAAFNIRGQRIQEDKGLVIRGGKMMFVK